jgi:hypothetical protein
MTTTDRGPAARHRTGADGVSETLANTRRRSNAVAIQRKATGHPAHPGEPHKVGVPRWLQPKLQVNQPNDAHEQEADRVADLVTRTQGNVSPASPRIQRRSEAAPGHTETAPASVDRALAGAGRPLEPTLRRDMEQQIGHDFSQVCVHTDAAAEQSARDVTAHAYTVGRDVVFDAGRFAPDTRDGRRLLAHELTHVVQQSDSGGEQVGSHKTSHRAGGASVQRDAAQGASLVPSARELLVQHLLDMMYDRFSGIAHRLNVAVMLHPSPFTYVRQVFAEIDSDYEDNLAAAFVELQSDSRLDQFAATEDGRDMLDILYVAMITGDVSAFQKQQADRILFAKTRRMSPEEYAAKAKRHSKERPTHIFPVRFMRVTGGDYATPKAELLPNRHVRVEYPAAVYDRRAFPEVATLPYCFSGNGCEIPEDEIVGIKLYEQGGQIIYVPALALIEYSNQAIQSTSGKILDVSLAAASFGWGGAVAGGTKWGARLALADRVVTVIGVAAFVIQEHSDWIIRKFGKAGWLLVKTAAIANSAASIYGLGRLAVGGYRIVKDLRAASKACREQAAAAKLNDAETQIINKVDDEADALLKDLDDEAAQAGATTGTASQPTAMHQIDDPAAPSTSSPVATAPPEPTVTPPTPTAPSAPTSTTSKPMKAPPGGGPRPTTTATAKTVSSAKPPNPTVEKLPRSSEPLPDPNTLPPRGPRNKYPDFEPVGPDLQKNARAQVARLNEQLGSKIKIPDDRVLNAPWIGRIRRRGKIQSSSTSEGWLRNESRFWSQWEKQFPDDAKLLGPNRTVSPELANNYRWPTTGPDNVVGQKLVHHHVDNGSMTVAIPEKIHQQLSGQIHATATVVGAP